MNRRNILFLISDEHQARAMSCAGHSIVKTPNLDRLAARGTRFDKAYTPSPICVPARAALALGRYVHDIRYWDNAMAYDGRERGWGHILHDAGVAATSVGKLHYRNAEDPTGFTEQIVPMHIMDGVGQIWGSVRNPLPDIRRFPKVLEKIGAGYSKYNQYDELITCRAVEWLRRYARRAEPWLLFVSFVAPHFPLIVPQEYLDLYDPADMPLPEMHPERGYTLHPWVARMREFSDPDAIAVGDDDRRRLAIASYYGLCSFMDAQIGHVLEELESCGVAADTSVIYTSDHGETLGMRGRWGKSVLYRESTQVPLIMQGPGLAAGKVCSTPVSLIDLPPTFLDHFGIAPPVDWPGRSLLRIVGEPDDPERTVFSEYHAATSPSGGFMVANARWKYHYYVGFEPELFDLQNDPDERMNLAGSADHREIVTNMHSRLTSICDPDAVDARAKADQDVLVAKHGGPDVALHMGTPGETPPPV